MQKIRRDIQKMVAQRRSDLTWQERLPLAEALVACLRIEDEFRFSNAGDIKRTVAYFRPKTLAAAAPSGAPAREETDEAFRTVRQAFLSIPAFEGTVLDRVITNQIGAIQTQFERMTERETPSYSVTGGREDFLDALMAMFSSLPPEGECYAVTTPTFWLPNNMSSGGRLMSMLRMKAIEGCRITWLLVVNERMMNDPATNGVLSDMMEALRTIRQEAKEISAMLRIEIRWTRMVQTAYVDYLRDKQSFIHFASKPLEISGGEINYSNSVMVAPDFALDDGSLIALRVWPGGPSGRLPRLMKKSFGVPKLLAEMRDLNMSVTPGRQEFSTTRWAQAHTMESFPHYRPYNAP